LQLPFLLLGSFVISNRTRRWVDWRLTANPTICPAQNKIAAPETGPEAAILADLSAY